MKINMIQWKNDVISNKKKRAIPIMTHPGIELINESVYNAVTDGTIHFKAIQALSMEYPSAATTVIMDLTVEAEAFGSEIIFSEHEVPAVKKRIVHDYKSIQALQIPSLDKGRIPEYIKANQLTADFIKDKPVFSGCIGPYSLAARLYDMTEIMIAIYTESDSINLLLKKCTTFLIKYCKALKATGVNGIIIAEPAAGLLSNDDCFEYSSKYIKQIINEVQDENFAVILHNCGNAGQCTQAMIETNAIGYHFGNAIDMLIALKDCPTNSIVMGNLDPVDVFKISSVTEVKEKTKLLLEKTKNYPNFILSSGCDVPPDIPRKNIKAFFEALEEFNQFNKVWK